MIYITPYRYLDCKKQQNICKADYLISQRKKQIMGIKLKHLFFITFIFILTSNLVFAQTSVTEHSGKVINLTGKAIVLEYQKGKHIFHISKVTKFCVDGYQAKSWRKLSGEKNATVTTKVNEKKVIRIDNQLKSFSLVVYNKPPVYPQCRSKHIVTKRDLIREVQLQLLKKGYDPGIADGYTGSRTTKTVKSFEQDHGLPETGNVTMELLERLEQLPDSQATKTTIE